MCKCVFLLCTMVTNRCPTTLSLLTRIHCTHTLYIIVGHNVFILVLPQQCNRMAQKSTHICIFIRIETRVSNFHALILLSYCWFAGNLNISISMLNLWIPLRLSIEYFLANVSASNSNTHWILIVTSVIWSNFNFHTSKIHIRNAYTMLLRHIEKIGLIQCSRRFIQTLINGGQNTIKYSQNFVSLTNWITNLETFDTSMAINSI